MKSKKIIKTSLVLALIAGTTSFTVFAKMPNGTAVVGDKAYDLNYIAKHITKEENQEIRKHVVQGKEIYVKDYSGQWVYNSTNEKMLHIEKDIPQVIYKDENGKQTKYNLGDTDVSEEKPKEGNKDENEKQASHIYIQKISEFKDVEIYQEDKYTLPTIVTVSYSNGMELGLKVTWDKVIDTNIVGEYILTGNIDSISQKVTLKVTVKDKNVSLDQKPLLDLRHLNDSSDLTNENNKNELISKLTIVKGLISKAEGDFKEKLGNEIDRGEKLLLYSENAKKQMDNIQIVSVEVKQYDKTQQYRDLFSKFYSEVTDLSNHDINDVTRTSIRSNLLQNKQHVIKNLKDQQALSVKFINNKIKINFAGKDVDEINDNYSVSVNDLDNYGTKVNVAKDGTVSMDNDKKDSKNYNQKIIIVDKFYELYGVVSVIICNNKVQCSEDNLKIILVEPTVIELDKWQIVSGKILGENPQNYNIKIYTNTGVNNFMLEVMPKEDGSFIKLTEKKDILGKYLIKIFDKEGKEIINEKVSSVNNIK